MSTTNSQVWHVCLHLYTSWTQMQGTKIVCACVCLPSIEGRVFSPHNSITLISPLKTQLKTSSTHLGTGNQYTNRIKQDRHGMTWIWINTNKQSFPTLVCARVTLQCDRHCCCVSSIVGNLLGTIDLLGKPLRWIKISWHSTVNEQAPVFAFLSLVDLILCLLLCLFVNLLRLVRHCCLYVSESSTNKTRYRTSKKSKRVKTWNFVQTLIKQSNSSGNFPTGIVLLPPWCRCHLWNDGCCLNTRRGIILYHRLLACPRSNPWCLNCNLRKCDGKNKKRCWYVLS